MNQKRALRTLKTKMLKRAFNIQSALKYKIEYTLTYNI
jgi:hypothetical protein